MPINRECADDFFKISMEESDDEKYEQEEYDPAAPDIFQQAYDRFFGVFGFFGVHAGAHHSARTSAGTSARAETRHL